MNSDTKASRLLIVDDEPGTILALAAILEEFGEIRFATNGPDAIDMIGAWAPDIVLLDAQMPGPDGFEVCRKIKRNPIHADLPILFVTACTAADSEIAALAAGAVDYIPKPLRPALVKARIQTHLTLKQRSDELNRLAMVDALTGIANRRRFDLLLDQECRRAYRSNTCLSALLIDIDHFKAFNDSLGHEAGDSCLRAVAQALAASANRPGEVLARFGGEEFAIVIPSCNLDHAVALGRKMCDAVRALDFPHPAAPPGIVTVSIGAATLDPGQAVGQAAPPESDSHANRAAMCRNSAKGLINLADRALYAAKSAGRNRVMAVTERVDGTPARDRAAEAS